MADVLLPAAADITTLPLGQDELLDQFDFQQRAPAQSPDASTPSTADRVIAQGPWDQVRTESMLRGAPSLPMPVKIASPDSLQGCFTHLRLDGGPEPLADSSYAAASKEEPFYNVPYVEYEKGVIFADRRLDLCKMVLGPLNIDALMDSLEGNSFVRHFLLGNNIIGPAGARRIARFVRDHPDRMDTWYLAGNCIDATGFRGIVDSVVETQSVASNIWLKRNPLHDESAADVARLIIRSQHLETLDLDQTELGDEGVARVFDLLHANAQAGNRIRLRHIYLNATGVGPQASSAIARFLGSEQCELESLFLSNNPIGDTGAAALATGLHGNRSLQRLMLSSTGLTSAGATSILHALSSHPRLHALDLGQSFATADLGGRYNYIDDAACIGVLALLRDCSSLRYLCLDHVAMSHMVLNQIYTGILAARNVCWVKLSTVSPSEGDAQVVKGRIVSKKLLPHVKNHLHANVKRLYDGMDYVRFENEEKRWLASPRESVRKIDSVYRNRDAGKARRGLMKLDKWWDEADGTLEEVMAS